MIGFNFDTRSCSLFTSIRHIISSISNRCFRSILTYLRSIYIIRDQDIKQNLFIFFLQYCDHIIPFFNFFINKTSYQWEFLTLNSSSINSNKLLTTSNFSSNCRKSSIIIVFMADIQKRFWRNCPLQFYFWNFNFSSTPH